MVIYDVKGRDAAVPAGTGEFHVFTIECDLTLTCTYQHQIIKAGLELEESQISLSRERESI